MRRYASLPFAIVLSLPGCWRESGEPPEVGETSHASIAVTWNTSSMVGVSASPSANSLVKTGMVAGFNAGAVSNESIDRRGILAFTTAEKTTRKAVGLNNVNGGVNMDDIDYAIQLLDNGTVTVRENGIHRGNFGNYVANDSFYITVQAGVVIYWKNTQGFYTSEVEPTFPLYADTTLHTPNATIRNVQIASTKLYIATQNNLLPSGVSSCGDNDVVVLGGNWLLVQNDDGDGVDEPGEITLPEFLAMDVEEDLVPKFEQYLNTHDAMVDFDGILVLDMEKPHPNDLGNDAMYSDEVKNQIVDAWIRRIQAVQQVYFERENQDVRIAMYGTLVPQGRGDEQNQAYIDRVEALNEAALINNRWGEQSDTGEGLYDRLDYLVPVLFYRFGCDAVTGVCDVADLDDDGDEVDDYQAMIDDVTDLGVVDSRTLALRPILPLLSVHVDNCTTCTNFENVMLRDMQLTNPANSLAALQMTLGRQLDVLANLNVTEAALWIGNGSNYEADPPDCPGGSILCVGEANNDPPVEWTIDDYTCEL